MVNNIITKDYRNIDDDFNKFLEKNAEEIREWPSWKLDIWGPVKKPNLYSFNPISK